MDAWGTPAVILPNQKSLLVIQSFDYDNLSSFEASLKESQLYLQIF